MNIKAQLILSCLFFSLIATAAIQWPIHLTNTNKTVTIFPPQPERMTDNILFYRSAIAVHNMTQTSMVHGVTALFSNIYTNETSLTLTNFHIQNIQIPDLSNTQNDELQTQLNTQAETWGQDISPETLDIMLNLANQSTTQTTNEAPQTTTVRRDDSLIVNYQGGLPRFVPIKNTRLEFAQNSTFQVLKDEDQYYCADRGIWYGAKTPNGPWRPTQQTPRDIQRIPPSHPMHNTSFLYVGTQGEHKINYGFYPGYLNERQTWGRLGGWGIDFESPDYSIQMDPRSGMLQYHEQQNTPKKPKNWGRNSSKFPEFQK